MDMVGKWLVRELRNERRRFSWSVVAIVFVASLTLGVAGWGAGLLSSEAASVGNRPGSGGLWAEPLKVGASGWITGMDIDPTGATYVLRTDTYGAYVGDGVGAWQQVVRADTMPAGFIQSFTQGGLQSLGQGVYEIRVAPSNPGVIYMIFDSRVYKSTNRAASWALLAGFPNVGILDPNDSFRMWGEKAAVDPVNPDVVYVGTVRNGLYVSTDGGASWKQVPTNKIPVATYDAGITGIVFDRAGGTTGGKTNIIYVGSNGNGVYRSTDAGASWAPLAGGPTAVSHAAIASDGVYYAATASNGLIYRHMGGVWSTTDTGLQFAASIAPDPSDPARIVAGRDSGHLAISPDRGSTWENVLWHQQLAPGDVPHLALSSSSYMSNGQQVFDPVTPDKLWFSAGFGVWFTADTHASFPTNIVWQARSSGIEQIVARDIAVPPGSANVFAAGADRSLWVLPKANATYPAANVTFGSQSNLIIAYAVDYSRANPRHIVALVNGGQAGEPELSGYSLDDGATWRTFSAQPGSGGFGGDIIAPNIDSIIAVVGTRYTYRSTDRGASWTPLSLPSDSGANSSDLHCGYNCRKHILAVDGANPNTVYLYFYSRGLYKSTNAGATWALVSNNLFDGSNMYWQVKLRSVPGQAGHLFLTAGQAGSDGQQNPHNTNLWRSTDGGASWSTVPGFEEPYDVALGKAAPGHNYPAIYVVGWYNQVYGIWRSIDNGAAWTNIGPFPFGSIDQIYVLTASQDSFGEIYFAFSGSGWGRMTSGPADLLYLPMLTKNAGALAR